MSAAQVLAALDYSLLLIILWVAVSSRRRNALVLAVTQLAMLVGRDVAFGHPADVQPAFAADGLSLVMAALVTLVGPLVILYASDYLTVHEAQHGISVARRPRFFLSLLVFLGAMLGLILANSLDWLFFFWEVTTLCSFILISYDGSQDALSSGFVALELNLMGGVAFLGGLLVFRALEVPPYLQVLAQQAPSGPLMVGVALLVIAALTKAAQLPFESWLLRAMVAPTPVSALLHSSTMVKAGVYLLLRLSPLFRDGALGQVVAVLGGLTFATTAASAVAESNGKRILAYSTIGNLGLIVVCAGLATPLSLTAGLVLTFFHAISKALLFLCMGLVEQRTGSRNVETMDALLIRMPFTTLVMALGMFSMLLPPFGVLIGKWITMEAAARLPVVLVLVVLGSALTLVYWAKWLGKLLAGPFVSPWPWEHLGIRSRVALTTLALLVAGTSVAMVPLLRAMLGPVMSSLGTPGGLAVAGGALVSKVGFFRPGPLYYVTGLLLIILPFVLARVRPATVRAPYLCGENAGESGLEFRAAADATRRAHVGGYYFERLFPRDRLSFWADAGAVGLLLLMVGVALR